MKASELMVGDWVYAIDDNGEKHPCRANNLEYDYTNKRGDFCVDFYGTGYEAEWPDVTFNVEPIPITPEILEKNGFVQNPRSKSRRSHQICTDSVYISWWRGRLNILFKPFIGHSTNHVNVDGKYVHELQHALRICGIEKEIVL
jgi:hypothetical protein